MILLLSFIYVDSILTNEYLIKANETYEKVIPCLKRAWMMADKSIDFKFPDDAEYHYEELINRTARFRQAPVHEYAGYEGPWIENIWIKEYMNKPLSFFNGFIPLFIQWIDTQILRGRHFGDIHYELNQILRPNVLYLAISQGDVGLAGIGTSHPNILVLSAGGFGHVPIPLIRGEIKHAPISSNFTFKQDIAFFGEFRLYTRPDILAKVLHEAEILNMTYRQGRGPTWETDMQETKFNLAPRGYGRSSFRFAESIQMGRIVAHIHDDIPWVAYHDTKFSVKEYGFLSGLTDPNNTIENMVHQMKSLTDEQFTKKIDILTEAREHFTYTGVLKQIEALMNDPFGPNGGYLRCIDHPRTERCCG